MTPGEADQKIKELLAREQSDYLATIKALRTRAIAGKRIVAHCGTEELLRLKMEDFGSYFEFLLNICYSLSVFPDPSMYEDLDKLGVSSAVTKWFVEWKSIDEQLIEIEKKGIIVLKNQALQMILLYLYAKVQAGMLSDCDEILGENGGSKEEIMTSLQNIFRRREYGKGNLATFKSGFDLLMNAQISETDKDLFGDARKTKKFYLDSFNGKVEKMYVKELITCLIPPEGKSGTWFADAIAGLLKLLLKGEKSLLDEEGFFEGEALYGNNYKRYLANRIGKIAGLGEPDFFES